MNACFGDGRGRSWGCGREVDSKRLGNGGDGRRTEGKGGEVR